MARTIANLFTTQSKQSIKGNTMSNVITKASKSDDTTENMIIKNVEFFWAKLGKPVVNQFNDDLQYELQIRVPTKRRADIEVLGTVKHPTKDGVEDKKVVYVNLKKKAVKADGSPAAPVRVVDAEKNEFDGSIIGNGSMGNVIVMRKPYEIKNAKTGKVTKTGISTALSAIQVTKLVEYKGSSNKITDMFDIEEGDKVAEPSVVQGDDF